MKLFKWIIEIKTKDLTSEEKIIYLANELINQCQKNGFELRKQSNCLFLNVSAHRIDSEDSLVIVSQYPENSNKLDEVIGELKIKIK